MDKRKTVPNYSRDYSRGWRASANPKTESPLEDADMRGERDAWYDGYSDHACDMPRYHSAICDKGSSCDIH
jgi:hypothetical protein